MKIEMLLVPNSMFLAETFFIPAIHFKGLVCVALFGFGIREVTKWRTSKVAGEIYDESNKTGLAAYLLTQEEHMQKMRRKFNGIMSIEYAALTLAVVAEVIFIILNIIHFLPSATPPLVFHRA